MSDGASESFDPRIDLAVQRTELAEDRTLLAWVRTNLGLMGAGVAFDKGVRYFHEARLASGAAWVRSGHVVGISFTAASTLLLAIVVWNYLRSVRTLAGMGRRKPPRATPAFVAAVLVVVLGCGVLTILIISNS